MEKKSLRPKYIPSIRRFLLYATTLFIVWKLYISYSIQGESAKFNNQAKQMVLIDTLPTSELLQKIKSRIDSSCPKKIDNVTTLESSSIFGTDTLQYNYSLNLNRARYDAEKIKSLLAKQIQSGLNMKEFRRKNITVIYSYTDSTGTFWFNEILAPSNNYIPK